MYVCTYICMYVYICLYVLPIRLTTYNISVLNVQIFLYLIFCDFSKICTEVSSYTKLHKSLMEHPRAFMIQPAEFFLE